MHVPAHARVYRLILIFSLCISSIILASDAQAPKADQSNKTKQTQKKQVKWSFTFYIIIKIVKV